MVRVHCRRKPLHSSAEPVKGAGLAKTIGEEVLGVVLGSGGAEAEYFLILQRLFSQEQ